MSLLPSSKEPQPPEPKHGFTCVVGDVVPFASIPQPKIKKKRRKTRTYEMLIGKKSVVAKIHERIDSSEKIPKTLKRRYKAIECDVLKLLVINLPFDITPEEITQFFNTFLIALNPELQGKRTKPVMECEIGATRKFAVMTMLNLECLWKLLKCETFSYKGGLLRVMRPKGFFAKHFEAGNFQWDEHGNLIDLDEGEECKLYLGNLPQYLTEDSIRKMVEYFGPLKSFQLKIEPAIGGEAISKGYCILEYQSTADAERAIASLNGQVVGDRALRMQKLVSTGQETLRERKKVAPTKETQTSFLLMFPRLKDPRVQAMLAVPTSCTSPSRVVQFLNMFIVEDLFEEAFYHQLLHDLREENSKYGTVEKVEIPRPDLATGLCSPSAGKAFVKFEQLLAAQQAQHRMNGRTYLDRTIVCCFYPEDKFKSGDYLRSL